MTEWIEIKKNSISSKIEKAEVLHQEQKIVQLLSKIYKERNPLTGWTKMKGLKLNNQGLLLLKYLEKNNLVVIRNVEIKLKNGLMERLVKEMPT